MLDHRVLLYRSQDEFAGAAVPFLAGGIEAGEPVLVVTDDANIALLRDGLGRSAGKVEFVPASGWYRTPGHAIQRYRAFVEDKAAAGAPWVRILGELGRGGLAASELRWWSSYEALLNLVLGSHPVTVLCPYDTRALGEEAARLARLTHPHEVENGALVPCAGFSDPAAFVLEPLG